MRKFVIAAALALAPPLATAAAQTPLCHQTPGAYVNAAGQVEQRAVCPPHEINQPTVNLNLPTARCRDGSVVTSRNNRAVCAAHGGLLAPAR